MSVHAIRIVERRKVCSCRTDRRGEGCETCRLFCCAGCEQWVPWSKGADDDMPGHCDDCWAKAHKSEAS